LVAVGKIAAFLALPELEPEPELEEESLSLDFFRVRITATTTPPAMRARTKAGRPNLSHLLVCFLRP